MSYVRTQVAHLFQIQYSSNSSLRGLAPTIGSIHPNRQGLHLLSVRENPLLLPASRLLFSLDWFSEASCFRIFNSYGVITSTRVVWPTFLGKDGVFHVRISGKVLVWLVGGSNFGEPMGGQIKSLLRFAQDSKSSRSLKLTSNKVC